MKSLGKKKSLIDEEANYEDIWFELECEWDKEPIIAILGLFCEKTSWFILFKWKVRRYMDLKLIDNKEILREPSKKQHL